MEQEKKEALQQQSEESGLQQGPPQPETEAAKESGKGHLHIVLTKKLLYTVLAAVGGIALVLVLVFTLIIPLGKRIRSSNEISHAVTSYQKGEMSFTEAEKQIREYYFVTAQSNQAFRAYEKLCDAFFDQTVKDLKAGTISYEQAKKKFALLESSVIGNVAQAAKQGRERMIAEYAFEQSEKLAEKGEYQQAIALLREVAEGAEGAGGHEEAQKREAQCIEQWAEALDGQIESMRENNQFEEALAAIEEFEEVGGSDRFSEKSKTLLQEKAEYDRQNPLISAEITSVKDGWLYDRYEYDLTNHLDRVLRKTEIVILIFDENGAPIDSFNGAWDIEDENGKEVVNAETDLEFWGGVQPGETKECYGYADGDAVKYKICVRSAEFEDGETWENPYFKVWLSEEKDRY